MGTGRDAADASFAIFFGLAVFRGMNIAMEAEDGGAPPYVIQSISSSDG